MIFIVDDDPSIQRSLTRLLRSAGYEARAFANAAEFLHDLDAAGAAVGCVILDVHMPGMSGPDLQDVINRRVPPCRSMIERQIDRPIPIPSGLVV